MAETAIQNVHLDVVLLQACLGSSAGSWGFSSSFMVRPAQTEISAGVPKALLPCTLQSRINYIQLLFVRKAVAEST